MSSLMLLALSMVEQAMGQRSDKILIIFLELFRELRQTRFYQWFGMGKFFPQGMADLDDTLQ